MKRFTLVIAVAVGAMFLYAQNASAFPGERMPYRAGHFAGKVAANIDNHVVHPVTHGVKRRLR